MNMTTTHSDVPNNLSTKRQENLDTGSFKNKTKDGNIAKLMHLLC